MVAVQPQNFDSVASEYPEVCASLRTLADLYRGLQSVSAEEVARKILVLPKPERDEFLTLLSRMHSVQGSLSTVFEQKSAGPEASRPPLATEPNRIRLEHTVLLTKESKIEYDCRMRGVDYETLLEQYAREQVKIVDILAAHEGHTATIKLLKDALPGAVIRPFWSVGKEELGKMVEDADLVVAVGGDDTFKAIAAQVSTGFIVGLNSDPTSSHGALCYYNAASFIEAIPRLLAGEFLIEEWTRIQAEAIVADIGGAHRVVSPPIVSEIVIAEHSMFDTMRGALQYRDEDFKLKGSGVIVGTGAGSTGWLASARRHVYPFGKYWRKTEKLAEFGQMMAVLFGDPQLQTGEILPGQSIQFASSGNHQPEICGDSAWFTPFPRGSVVTIGLSPTPLKVIAPMGR
jgi:NAD kinase